MQSAHEASLSDQTSISQNSLEFGTYAQAHEEHNNSLISRTTGAIALRPIGNSQGGFYLYSLSSGRVLDRNNWTEHPMPLDFIDWVHILARRSRANQQFIFADRDRQPILDDVDEDDYDDDYDPNFDESDDDDDDDTGADEDVNDNPDDDKPVITRHLISSSQE